MMILKIYSLLSFFNKGWHLLPYLTSLNNPYVWFRSALVVGNIERNSVHYFILRMSIWASSSRMFANSHLKNSSRCNISFHTNDMTERAQRLNINALNHIHAVEVFTQLLVHSGMEIMANTYRIKRSYIEFFS